MYKEDLMLNNRQGLVYYKVQLYQPIKKIIATQFIGFKYFYLTLIICAQLCGLK